MVFRCGYFLECLYRHNLVLANGSGISNFVKTCSIRNLNKSIGGRSKFRFDDFCSGFGYHFSDGFTSDVFRRLDFLYFREYFLRFSNGLIIFVFILDFVLGGKV